MRHDRDDGTWKSPEDIASLIEKFVRGEDAEELTPEYQTAIGAMDEGNKEFFRTYRPKPMIEKRNAKSILFKGMLSNIQAALSKYPNVLNHEVFNKL